MGVGAGFALIGGLGKAIRAGDLCQSQIQNGCGNGTVSTGLIVAGGGIVVLGFALLITGVIVRNQAPAQPHMVEVAPIVTPDAAGMSLALRF